MESLRRSASHLGHFRLAATPTSFQAEPNAGVMLLRNSEAVHELLWDCYRHAEFKDHRWWEQAAIMCLLKQRPDRVSQKVVPHWAINSYPEEDTSRSFIVHAPGRTMEQRMAIFRSVMAAKVLVLIPVKPNLHPALSARAGSWPRRSRRPMPATASRWCSTRAAAATGT